MNLQPTPLPSPGIWRSFHRFSAVAVLLLAAGCASAPVGLPQQLPDRAERVKKSYVFYLDGAGGGTSRMNWAPGVRDGLLAAKYPGAGEMFSWETGHGLVADQDASDAYKRGKAALLAEKITKRARLEPGVPINILGFSAGTVIAVFALEALPPDVRVANVILLGCSLSDDYDLTKALSRINGKLWVFTSTHDRVLGFLMPFSGTADRKFGVAGAGIRGFVLPRGANPETKALYASKVVRIPWSKSFKVDRDYGHHFDNVKAAFIRDHVAPLLVVPHTAD